MLKLRKFIKSLSEGLQLFFRCLFLIYIFNLPNYFIDLDIMLVEFII